MPSPTLLAVPNISEGRDVATVEAISQAFVADGKVRLLDTHFDGDHHRAVFTLAGLPGALGGALLQGVRVAVERIDIGDRRERSEIGQHPYIGAVDVVPVVYLDDAARGAACAEALVVADRIGEECSVPVFLYGALAGGRARAELRRGGAGRLAERMRLGELQPEFGPAATVADARRIAALIREGGLEALPGLRAIGAELSGGMAQVSMNVERPLEVTLARVVAAVRRHAVLASAELVGLAPRAALQDFPEDLPLPGFDPARHLIENALAE